MKVRLSEHQFEYLMNHLLLTEESFASKIKLVDRNNRYVDVDTDTDAADKIRDLANDELQKSGFDINYELTPDGVLLEKLIDVFHPEA